MNKNDKDRKAIITGATSGIGAATVRCLSSNNIKVLAIARRQEQLVNLSNETGCKWFSADVRDTDAFTEQIDKFEPDILVNNAGVGHGISGMEKLSPEIIQEAFDINVISPIQISSLVIPGMRLRGLGHIINIGSIAGLHTLISAIYGSTKSAIHQFSQNLQYELRGSGIRVSEVCPGRVSSEFYSTAKGDIEKLKKITNSAITELRPIDVAETILFAINAPLHVNISTIEILPTEQAIGGVDMTPVKDNSE